MQRMRRPEQLGAGQLSFLKTAGQGLAGIYNNAVIALGERKRKRDGRYPDESVIFRKASQSHRGFLSAGRATFNEIDTLMMESRFDNRSMHVIGEAHGSIIPVKVAHELFAPKMRLKKEDWLILVEESDAIPPEGFQPELFSTQFYFRELALCLDIPYLEALASLDAPDTREFIQRRSLIRDSDIDRALLTMIIEGEDKDMAKLFMCERFEDAGRDAVRRLAFQLEKPVELIYELLAMGPLPGFEKLVGTPWNEFSRLRLHKLLALYPEKKDVLSVVGWNHLPVFNDSI
jgi:hypothetical protein